MANSGFIFWNIFLLGILIPVVGSVAVELAYTEGQLCLADLGAGAILDYGNWNWGGNISP